jgi:hypothetical protein
MRKLRAEGKFYEVIAGLCGLSRSCAQKWIKGETPKVQA